MWTGKFIAVVAAMVLCVTSCATQRAGLRSDVSISPIHTLTSDNASLKLVVVDNRAERERSAEVVALVSDVFRSALSKGGVVLDPGAEMVLEITISAYRSSFSIGTWSGCVALKTRLILDNAVLKEAEGNKCETASNMWGYGTADSVLKDALEQSVQQVSVALNRTRTVVPSKPQASTETQLAQTTSSNTPASTTQVVVQGSTETRVALVVGASAYDFGRLRNPVNDAKLMAETLRSIQFKVDLLLDPDQATLKRAVDSFGAKIPPNGVALFYYAGHGVQVEGRNYLIPIRAKIQVQSDIDIEGVDVARLLARLGHANGSLNIVILDACRNNPFAQAFRSLNRGLAFVQAPSGTLIAYATAPGDEAQDGVDGHSPYTSALAKELKTPGIPIEETFKAVRRTVQATTNGRQTPWESSSLIRPFAFAPRR